MSAFLLPFLTTAVAQSGNVEFIESSEPANIVSRTTYPEIGSRASTSLAPATSLGYRFTHWTVDGVRVNEPTGRAVNPVTITVVRRSEAIAYYLPENQDTDADGWADAFEIEYFGDLSQDPASDADGDGYENAMELAAGQSPIAFDDRVEGGISRRRDPARFVVVPGVGDTNVFYGGISRRRADTKTVVLNNAYASLDENSDPSGLVASSRVVLKGSPLWLTLAPESSLGYRYTGWFSGGVRLDQPWQKQPIPIAVNGPTLATARYIPETADTDADGLSDWMEWYDFNTLTNGPADDPDSDGFSTSFELFRGYVPFVSDDPSDGGISRRRSEMKTVVLNQAYANLEENSDPSGIVANSRMILSGSTVWLTTAPESSLGYRYTGWLSDGVRIEQPWQKQPIPITVNGSTLATARYIAESADTDADGLADWMEWYHFNTLANGPADDPDGDGLSTSFELFRGYVPFISDDPSDGGISRRRSDMKTVVLNQGYANLEEKSDPSGIVASSRLVLSGSTVWLTTAPESSLGYRFTGWLSDGVRLEQPWQKQPIPIMVNGSTLATARYIAESADTDADGLADWMEWYNFNTLANGPEDDPDGDGLSTSFELFRGYVTSIHDDPSAGGISRRRSVLTAVNHDVYAPADPTGFRFDATEPDPVLRWVLPPDTDGDFAGLRVYVTNGVTALSPTVTSLRLQGLARATAYVCRITSLDNDGNESRGAFVTGYTWLDNPTNVVTVAYPERVLVAWDSAVPASYVKRYAVYCSEASFASVTGMTPRVTTTGRSVFVPGLQNNREYFFAVVTVNKSDGLDPRVDNVRETPEPDIVGPTFTDVRFSGAVVTNGLLIEADGELRASATDLAGVSRVEFWAGDTRIGSDSVADPAFSVLWNAEELVNGPVALLAKAYDNYGNLTVVSNSVVVRIPPPAEIPVLTQPADGAGFARSPVRVSGRVAGRAKDVVVFVGGSTGAVVSVSMDRTFTAFVPLTDGTNLLRAAARNFAGLGPASAPIAVFLDTTLPLTPLRLVASSREGGEVRLTWWQPSGGSVVGYHVFRSGSPFTATNEARRVSSGLVPVAGAAYVDLPPADGTWYYRVVAVNRVGTWSVLSEQVEAKSDRTPPSGALTYSSTGARVGDRFGPGTVRVLLETTEAPEATPFLTFTRTNGLPIVISLTRAGPTSYQGSFAIQPTLGTLAFFATFSARDAVGNRGTDLTAGGHIVADTEGPVAQVTLDPFVPIPNVPPGPHDVRVTLRFDTNDVPAALPTLAYVLSVVQTSAVPLVLTSSNAWTYSTALTLPEGAGATDELLDLRYAGVDALGNTGTVIRGWAPVDVYQVAPPALAAPAGVQSVLGPQGRVDLAWDPVSGASGYAVHRRAPGESALSPLNVTSSNAWSDLPPEGQNRYAIATLRSAHGLVVTGVLSDAVSVTTDITPPAMPQGLTAVAWPGGIACGWRAVTDSGAVRYRLYRSTAPVTNPAALTPIIANIVSTQALDTAPIAGGTYYAVTALDARGNESGPSASAYLNLSLLPVQSLAVDKVGAAPPVLAWQHAAPAQIDGYAVYLGSGAGARKLHDGTLPAASNSLVDVTYDGLNRLYAVAAVDEVAGGLRESLRREILLPALDFDLVTNAPLRRGVMNPVVYRVANRSGVRLGEMRIGLLVAGHQHWTDPFHLAINEARDVALTVGGFRDLPSIGTATNTVWIHPADGEDVRIRNAQPFTAVNDSLSLTALAASFVRGAWGQCRFELVNTCEETVEVITALGSGSADSPDVSFSLENADGMVYAVVPLRQVAGAGVITLPGGESVARLAPGERLTCAPMAIPVPSAVGNQAVLRVTVARLHHAVGTERLVTIDGSQAYTAVNLVDTPYFATLTNVAPAATVGTNPVHLAGQAIRRSSGAPEPGVPVRVVLTRDGFERTYTVYTDEAGNWSYDFRPLSTEHGIYTVNAVHPDNRERPAQGRFLVQQVWISPTTGSVSIPREYEQGVWVDVRTGEGTVLTNARVVFRAEDQPGGALPAGVSVGLPQAVDMPGSGSQRFNMTIRAATNAATSVPLVLRVMSDTPAPGDWGTLTLNCNFRVVVEVPAGGGGGSGVGAAPVLAWTPGYVEVGVAVSNVVSASVDLRNVGHADMLDMQLALVDTNGAPAPAWILLNANPRQGILAAGERRSVSLTFAPDGTVAPRPQAPYEYRLRVWGANHPTNEVPLFVFVDNSGQGNALFHIMDIYTGTLGGDGQPIAGLAGATIKLTRENAGLPFAVTAVSDALGEARLRDLPVGSYRVRISAPNHNDRQDRIWIQPGVTMTREYTLESPLITVEWSVEETTIQDRYEIVLRATYQTDVPAAVVVIEPHSITIPDLHVGEVFNGEFTVRNYGLIRAENVHMEETTSDEFYKFELLAPPPATLEAKQVVRVPYRITCLKRLDGAADGGGCLTYGDCHTLWYFYRCSNGEVFEDYDTFCTSKIVPGCDEPPFDGPPPRGFDWSITDPVPQVDDEPVGGGEPPRVRGPEQTVEGIVCGPKIYCEVWDEKCKCRAREAVSSSVNLLNGEYNDDLVDLKVRVSGFDFTVRRSYYANKWMHSLDETGLKVESDSVGGVVGVRHGGVLYPSADDNGKVFAFGDRLIVVASNGFRYSDHDGNWKDFDAQGRVLRAGNRNGRFLTYAYSPEGLLSGVVDQFGSQVLWITRDEGRIVSQTDDAGRQVRYAYDAAGRLVSVTSARGYTTTYGYTAEGRIASKRLPTGRTFTITYNAEGHVTSMLDESGQGKFFEYGYDSTRKEYYGFIRSTSGQVVERWFDESGVETGRNINGKPVLDESGTGVIQEKDARGNVTRLLYPDGSSITRHYESVFGNLIEEVNELGVVTRYEYDGKGNLTNRVYGVGTAVERSTRYEYDAYGNRTRIVEVGDAKTAESVSTASFDRDGNQIISIDSEGNVTSNAYDRLGNPTVVIDPRGVRWDYRYDADGHLLQIDGGGFVVSNEYDVLGSLVRSYDPAGRATTYTYDDHGREIRRVDPYGREWTRTYDLDGRLIHDTSPDGRERRAAYDDFGRLISRGSSDGDLTTFEYDTADRLVRLTDADGTVTEATYDDAGELAQLSRNGLLQLAEYDLRHRKIKEEARWSGHSHATRYAYDAAGRLVSASDSEGGVSIHTYDALGHRVRTVRSGGITNDTAYDLRGNVIQVKDGDGRLMRFRYDRKDRPIERLYADDTTQQFKYNSMGELAEKRNPAGQRVLFAYNALGRLVRKQLMDAGSNVIQTVTYDYDVYGRLVSWSNGVFRGMFEYDDANLTVTRSVDYGPFVKSCQYVYSHGGEVLGFVGPMGERLQFRYAKGILSAVDVPGEGQISVSQVGSNRSFRITYPGGISKECLYDEFTLRSMRLRDSSSNELARADYEVDNLGRLRTRQTGEGIWSFAYAASGPLAAVVTDGLPPDRALTAESYVYDGAGNRIRGPGPDDLSLYNELNQQMDSPSSHFTYDENGNVATKLSGSVTNQYEYDAENHLIAIRDGGGTLVARYWYGPDGQRLKKEAGGRTTYFVYANEGVVAEFDEAGQPLRTFGYAPSGMWGVHPLYMKVGGVTYYCINDHLGVPQYMVTGNTIAWHGEQDGFGRMHVWPESTIANPVRISGQYYDEESGLHYAGMRYYDPESGRFLTRDPIGEGAGLNLYQFADGDPVNRVDPMGLMSITTPTIGGDVKIAGIGLSWGINVSETSTKTEQCCKSGTKLAGQIVTDEKVEISIDGSLKASVAMGVALGKAGYGAEAWKGLKAEGGATVTGSGSLETDRCNRKELVGKVCAKGQVGISVSAGAAATVKVGFYQYEVGLYMTGSLGGSATKCYVCEFGACAWEDAKLCIEANLKVTASGFLGSVSWTLYERQCP